MKVYEMLKAIHNKELSIQQLADKYEMSDRTIQTRIKNLGFSWSSKEAKYKYNGDDQTVYQMGIDELFKKKTSKGTRKKKEDTKVIKNEIKKGKKEVASTITKEPEIINEVINSNVNTSKGEIKNIKLNNQDDETINQILLGEKPRKGQRGFYLDDDVLSIIDKIDSGDKSRLVNACLRKVFKEKGLL